MQYNYNIHIENDEDEQLFEYAKDYLLCKRGVNTNKIRPSELIYSRLTDKQKKIHDLLYSKQQVECPICYVEIDYKNEIKTDCNHVFCKDCINKLTETTNICPCCRNDMKYYNITFNEVIIIKIILIFCGNIFVVRFKKRPKDKYRYPLICLHFPEFVK
jgi:hypothetical protein